ncbi:MAG: UDP-glucose/GDP-mannose dehydrogenase family protein [Caldilineaceae bacterium]
MKISIFGLGYVGCVSAACLAQDGHQVVGVDVSNYKVDLLSRGKSPIVERGLDEIIAQQVSGGGLRATQDGQMAVLESDISLICVGTPSAGNGSLNTTFVEKVCSEIGEVLAEKNSYHLVVIRSTVLPTTVQKKLIPILEASSGRRAGEDFGVCMNPEFLREGSAVQDYYRPSYIVIGSLDKRSAEMMEKVYVAVEAPVIHTTIQTAEMVKYASNAFHAVKIAFANEIGNLSKTFGVDGREVMNILVQDRQLNISPTYLRPGFAFGGSCLPKDLRAILYAAKEKDMDLPMLDATLESNEKQIRRGVELVEKTGCQKVGILGLSFKSGTDDVRESPVVPLVETLIGKGYEVRIYDDIIKPEMLHGANKAFFDRRLSHIAAIICPSIEEVMEDSEVLVVTNGSPTFQDAPHKLLPHQTLIDLAGVIKKNGALRGKYEGICW